MEGGIAYLRSLSQTAQSRIPKLRPLLVCVQRSGQPMRDSPGRGNTSPYVKVSSNCLLLRLSGLAVFHTVHYSQPGGVGEQTDYQQGHSVPLLSPAAVVGCKRLCDAPTRSGCCDKPCYAMSRSWCLSAVLSCPACHHLVKLTKTTDAGYSHVWGCTCTAPKIYVCCYLLCEPNGGI